MLELFIYVIIGVVIITVEIQYRLEKGKVKRYESLWFKVVDIKSGEIVVDHSLRMFEELSMLGGFDWYYRGIVVELYRKAEGG